jgi:hypothetical protein
VLSGARTLCCESTPLPAGKATRSGTPNRYHASAMCSSERLTIHRVARIERIDIDDQGQGSLSSRCLSVTTKDSRRAEAR